MPACRNFQKTEIRLILNGFTGRTRERDKAFFLLGVTTGFRVSELCALTIGDVMTGGKIRNNLTVSRRKTKGKLASRTVPLLDEVRKLLGARVRELNRNGFFRPETSLFRMGRSRAYRVLRGCADRQGVTGNIGTHSLRKTFAHNIYQDFLERRANGIHLDPLLETSRALGHKTVQNTVAYLPESRALIDSAIRNLVRILQ